MITRAAVKIDYWNHNTKQEIIIPCHRHCDAFQILHDFGFIKGVDFREKEQGFLNSMKNLFTSRGDELRSKMVAIGLTTQEAEAAEKELDKGKLIIVAHKKD